jgi:hypothetical protein
MSSRVLVSRWMEKEQVSNMRKVKTYFEQIPVEMVKKIVEEEQESDQTQIKSSNVALPEIPNSVAHVVQFYTNDEFLLDSLCQFVRNALDDGESAILVATNSHRKGLIQRLHACGADVTASLKDGRCVILDASDTLAKFMEGNAPNPQKFASVLGSLIEGAQLKSGGTNVAVFGEMVAVLWSKEKFHAALQLEELWNDLAKTHSFYLRCAYPASSFHDEHSELYASICAKHSAVMPVAA